MYKTQFGKWGFIKNVGRKNLAAMARVHSERRARGKATAFKVNKRNFDFDGRLRADGIPNEDFGGQGRGLPASIRAFTPTPVTCPLLRPSSSPPTFSPLSPTFSP